MKLIKLYENGKLVMVSQDHIMCVCKGVDHAGKDVDMIVLSSGMSFKPDSLTPVHQAIAEGDE